MPSAGGLVSGYSVVSCPLGRSPEDSCVDGTGGGSAGGEEVGEGGRGGADEVVALFEVGLGGGESGVAEVPGDLADGDAVGFGAPLPKGRDGSGWRLA
ncbi:hypothetical protein [Amycolatopsis sp. NPDC051372]|uniref:hypothetical protein n=1 Tax=Amycolatopsis sp. NPDC051372 TaxID=3155669 RepID=UPI0034465873